MQAARYSGCSIFFFADTINRDSSLTHRQPPVGLGKTWIGRFQPACASCVHHPAILITKAHPPPPPKTRLRFQALPTAHMLRSWAVLLEQDELTDAREPHAPILTPATVFNLWDYINYAPNSSELMGSPLFSVRSPNRTHAESFLVRKISHYANSS